MEREPQKYKHSVVEDNTPEDTVHASRVFGNLKDCWDGFLSGVPELGLKTISSCIVCDSEDISPFFKRGNFEYSRCGSCFSVFLNPRVSDEKFESILSESGVLDLIREKGYQEEIKARFDNFVEPLIEPLFYMADSGDLSFLEINGKDANLIDYLSSHKRTAKIYRYKSLNPVKNEMVVEIDSLDDIDDGTIDVFIGVTSFESMPDPKGAFVNVVRKVRKAGLVFILGRTGSGFDIQVLKGSNDAIIPFEHMNLISVEGFEILCGAQNLEIKELSTPGVLDTKYVKERIFDIGGLEFMHYFFEKRSKEEIKMFQKFLQRARLSSSLRLICSPR